MESFDAVREGYRSVYAQALIQLHKDLDSPIQHFFTSARNGVSAGIPWYEAFTGHLAALSRDRQRYGGFFFVPRLSHAVDLWVDGRMSHCGMELSRNVETQRQVNAAISNRLDIVFEQGDPYLAAVCVSRFPNLPYVFCLNTGIPESKAREITAKLVEKANVLAAEAEEAFAKDYPPVKLSMFRPLPQAQTQERSNEN